MTNWGDPLEFSRNCARMIGARVATAVPVKRRKSVLPQRAGPVPRRHRAGDAGYLIRSRQHRPPRAPAVADLIGGQRPLEAGDQLVRRGHRAGHRGWHAGAVGRRWRRRRVGWWWRRVRWRRGRLHGGVHRGGARVAATATGTTGSGIADPGTDVWRSRRSTNAVGPARGHAAAPDSARGRTGAATAGAGVRARSAGPAAPDPGGQHAVHRLRGPAPGETTGHEQQAESHGARLQATAPPTNTDPYVFGLWPPDFGQTFL